ncbi:4006_t:CDS:2 [Cetraspora pellucida]|uniref:4006_t:CDS:1 n=1 Tax=Cetraspora pellucida TaxID=1433469 RepID=A0A9N9GXG1_9GLOM|nr:4006_t:CDS:2 [Cetraspora pellucida]
MSFKTKATKALIKYLIGGSNSQNSQNSTERTDQPTNTGRPFRKNKWKIPPGLTEKEARILKKVKKRAELLDVGFCVCCCCKVGLVPVIGDFMSTILSLMLISVAKEIGLPKYVISQMMFNVFIDFMFGLIPVAGDFFDFLYKANIRNAIILENYLVDRAKNRSVVIEDGSVEVIRPENAVPGRDRTANALYILPKFIHKVANNDFPYKSSKWKNWERNCSRRNLRTHHCPENDIALKKTYKNTIVLKGTQRNTFIMGAIRLVGTIRLVGATCLVGTIRLVGATCLVGAIRLVVATCLVGAIRLVVATCLVGAIRLVVATCLVGAIRLVVATCLVVANAAATCLVDAATTFLRIGVFFVLGENEDRVI